MSYQRALEENMEHKHKLEKEIKNLKSQRDELLEACELAGAYIDSRPDLDGTSSGVFEKLSIAIARATVGKKERE